MKKLKITVNGQEFFATCCTNQVPKTIEAFEQELPASGYLRHAKICDNEWMLPLPCVIDVDEAENKVRPNPGDIGYNRMRQFFCGWYDDMEPLGFTNLIAVVDAESFPAYREQMSQCWSTPGQLITVEIVEG